ncbi:MAG: ECF-type sigma factor [Verrucomicrobiota bacterium]
MEQSPVFSHFSEEDLRRLYPVLRGMAGEKMAFENPGHTLQPTALVHEAWIRMREYDDQSWRDSAHFCAAAAETMRRILIDRARRRARRKHGGDLQQVPMTDAEEEPLASDEHALLINEALKQLGEVDPVRARVVLLKYFGGLSNREIAVEMSVTERTVERYWAYARAWLYREIRTLL